MREKILAIFVAMVLALSVPTALANDAGAGVGIDVETEDFEPLIWLCDSRLVLDDGVEGGRVTGDGDPMWERMQNYAFEGEQIQWQVLVMDKNGIEKISDVYVTVDDYIEANCDISSQQYERIPETCNARIDEEELDYFDPNTQRFYDCTFTVETPNSMYGEAWVSIEVEDLDGLTNTIDENEYWFLNPTIALDLDSSIDFGTVRPGTTSYAETFTVGNDADFGSGVMLDMFISGTDFYDSSSSGAKCPTTNELSLSNFAYFATNGAWSSYNDVRSVGDAERYVSIGYGDHWETSFYGNNEIIQTTANPFMYSPGNLLSPGSEMAVTFRLELPEPCNGDFDSGSIYFWGEAI